MQRALLLATLLAFPTTAHAAESERGAAYVQADVVGVAILFASIDSGSETVGSVTTSSGRFPVEIHGGYHLSGRHDGFVVGASQKLLLGDGSGGATVARAGWDIAIPLGRRELTLCPYGFGGALYGFSGGGAGAYFGAGFEGRFFPIKTADKQVQAEGPKRVVVAADHIVIKEKVQFRLNEAIIEKASASLLDEIASVILKNPQIKQLLVEGHASAEGDAVANEKLSDARAKAVREELVARGVTASTLESKGFGAKRPIASNDNEEGREKNRRVELRITKQDATVEHVEEAKETGSGSGFFVTFRPVEIGYATTTPGVLTFSVQAGAGYAF